MLLSLLSTAAAFPASASLGQLAADESLRIAYQSKGCFHARQYEIAFEGGASVTARAAGRSVRLSPKETAGLDRLFAFYRSRPRGACTTVDRITITRLRAGKKLSSENYVDRSCTTDQMRDVTRLEDIARKLGMELQ